MVKKWLMVVFVFVSFASAKVYDINNFNFNSSEKICADAVVTGGISLKGVRFITPLMCIDNELYSAQVSGMRIPNHHTETDHITPIAKLGKRCYCNHNGKLQDIPRGMVIDFKKETDSSE